MPSAFAAEKRVASRLRLAAASSAMDAWTSELVSAVQYRMPTRLADGSSLCSRSNCASTGVRSIAPVALPPGFLLLLATPAAARSVIAAPTTGICGTMLAIACSAGVPSATARLHFSLANAPATPWQNSTSLLACCTSSL